MANISSKLIEPLWEQKWQCHLQIFSWRKLKQELFNKAIPSQEYGNVTLTTISLFGTAIYKKSVTLLIKPTNKFTAKVSDNKITFLDTVVFKGERFKSESILDIKTHYKPTETFQYTHFTSCHLPGVKGGFIKGEAIRLLRTNSSKTTFEECLSNFNYALKRMDIQRQS